MNRTVKFGLSLLVFSVCLAIFGLILMACGGLLLLPLLLG